MVAIICRMYLSLSKIPGKRIMLMPTITPLRGMTIQDVQNHDLIICTVRLFCSQAYHTKWEQLVDGAKTATSVWGKKCKNIESVDEIADCIRNATRKMKPSNPTAEMLQTKGNIPASKYKRSRYLRKSM